MPEPTETFRKNEEIRVPVVMLINEEGEKIGEIPTSEALALAEEKGLDLIEVSPKMQPPVAKILSWSKFKYDQSKKKKENKKKSNEMKEMWFKAFIDEGDLNHKLKKVQEFIKKKNSVKITIRAKGRVRKEHLETLMQKILLSIEEYAEPQGNPKAQGRNFGVIVKPRKTKLIKSELPVEVVQNENVVSDPDSNKITKKTNEEQNQNTQS